VNPKQGSDERAVERLLHKALKPVLAHSTIMETCVLVASRISTPGHTTMFGQKTAPNVNIESTW
jgi:hypothetical protein